MSDLLHDEYVVFLGARDWRHAAWLEHFYPEDMPEDWRLTFYATQFSCVWLEWDSWRNGDWGVFDNWLEDTPRGFRFLLEAGPGGDSQDLVPLRHAQRIHVLSRGDERIVWFDKDSDLRILTERLRGADAPLYLLSRDNDLAGVERIKTLLELLGL